MFPPGRGGEGWLRPRRDSGQLSKLLCVVSTRAITGVETDARTKFNNANLISRKPHFSDSGKKINCRTKKGLWTRARARHSTVAGDKQPLSGRRALSNMDPGLWGLRSEHCHSSAGAATPGQRSRATVRARALPHCGRSKTATFGRVPRRRCLPRSGCCPCLLQGKVATEQGAAAKNEKI